MTDADKSRDQLLGGETSGGGECEIDSLPGGGTTVNMRFRAADSTPDTVVDEERPATKPRDDVALIDLGNARAPVFGTS